MNILKSRMSPKIKGIWTVYTKTRNNNDSPRNNNENPSYTRVIKAMYAHAMNNQMGSKKFTMESRKSDL